jgi:hypothetical protein
MSMPIRTLDKSSGIGSCSSSSIEQSFIESDLSLKNNKLENTNNNNNNGSVDYSFLEEEIFEEDGTYEELLAYDNQEEEYLFEHNKRLNLSKRRRHGLPPITPKASMKDLVTNFLFDHMWSELINWSSDIIQTYAKTISDEFISDSLCKTPQPESNSSSGSSSNNNNNQIQLDISKESIVSNTNNNLGNSNQIINNNYNSTQQNSINNFTNQNNISNLNSTSNLATSLTKANVVQLKPFDSALNNSMTTNATNNNNNNNNTTTTVNPPFYHLLEKTTLSSGLLSRDNSTLYAHSAKFNDNLSSVRNIAFFFINK